MTAPARARVLRRKAADALYSRDWEAITDGVIAGVFAAAVVTIWLLPFLGVDVHLAQYLVLWGFLLLGVTFWVADICTRRSRRRGGPR